MNAQYTARLLALAIPLQLALGTAALAAPIVGLAAPTTGPAPIVGADYKVHAGDALAVSVYGEPALTQTVTVLPDETIEYPMVGRLSVANETPAQVSAVLRQALVRYLRAPIVSVGLLSEGQLTVMVLGNVKTPGKYTLPFNSHVTDAVAVAGGIGPVNGDYPVARISDTGGMREASLQQILRGGNASADVVLNNNSIIYIPSPVTFSVEVVGAVDKPGDVSISQGDRLSTAIAKAGNSVNANADLNVIRVTRDIGNGQTKVYNVNLYDALQHGDTSADLELQKNDVVYVPQAKKGGGSTIAGIFGLLGRLVGF